MKPFLRIATTKALRCILTLLITLTLLFCLLVLVKGNPISLYVNPHMTPEMRDNLKRIYGYDLPPLQQYLVYMGNLCRGELGISFNHKQPVTSVLAKKIPPSLWLGFWGYMVGLIISMFLLYLLNLGPKRLRVLWALIYRVNLTLPAFITGTLL